MSSPPALAGPRTGIKALLCSLYGEAIDAQTAVALADLIARRRPTSQCSASSSGLSERDALLITYADQVREDGVVPLQTLAAFCETRLTGIVSGVQLLPFYPWSSDDGFAVKD